MQVLDGLVQGLQELFFLFGGKLVVLLDLRLQCFDLCDLLGNDLLRGALLLRRLEKFVAAQNDQGHQSY